MERQVEKPAVTVSYYTISDVMTILGCKRTKAAGCSSGIER